MCWYAGRLELDAIKKNDRQRTFTQKRKQTTKNYRVCTYRISYNQNIWSINALCSNEKMCKSGFFLKNKYASNESGLEK